MQCWPSDHSKRRIRWVKVNAGVMPTHAVALVTRKGKRRHNLLRDINVHYKLANRECIATEDVIKERERACRRKVWKQLDNKLSKFDFSRPWHERERERSIILQRWKDVDRKIKKDFEQHRINFVHASLSRFLAKGVATLEEWMETEAEARAALATAGNI